NGHYIRAASDDYLFDQVSSLLPHLEGGPELAKPLLEDNKDRLMAALPALKERAKTLVQLVDSTYFIHASRPLEFDEKASGALNDEARAMLIDAHTTLSGLNEWNHDSISDALKGLADAKALKLGKIAQPIRAALTGRGTSPGAFDVLTILGRDEALHRIADQMTKLDN
ncbi:MAG: glutamate--tRNA ligase, partial [Pseudomonadota bacterium]